MKTFVRAYEQERDDLAHLRPVVEKEYGRRLSEQRWIELCARFPPHPDEDIWLSDVLADLRSVDEALRSAKAAAATETVVANESQDPRYAALAEILALEANHDPEVRKWRARNMPHGLVSEGELVDALARIGENPRWTKLPEEAIKRSRAKTTAERRRALAEAKAEVIWRARTRSTTSSANEALHEYAKIAKRLGEGFKWLADDVLVFLVTGRAPRYFPLIVRTRSTDRAATSRITLEVDPRVSQRELARAYTDAQAGGRLAGMVGGTSRRLEPRTSAIAVFLAHYLSKPWRERQRLWNEEHLEWESTDVRAFRTEAKRAWQRVVGGEMPNSEDEWLLDVRASAVTESPPGAIPRARP